MTDRLSPLPAMRLIDRRGDPPGRGAVNRERFVRRFKDEIKRAADDELRRRSITDVARGGRVSIPGRGLREPFLHHDEGSGSRDFVLPGNRHYVPGDTIARPQDGGRGGPQGDEPGEGEGRDSFTFVLSRDEFLALFFDDLELPNLERTHFGEVTLERLRRAGYARAGVPQSLAPALTVRMSIARRIALRGALAEQIETLERALEAADPPARARIHAEIDRLRHRRDRLPFIEDVDRRFRAHLPAPSPATRAAMLCLMDVSGSMDERKKDLAKRFFTLLYLFLERKYGQVEVVFIRHTEKAEEVDERGFFLDTLSGGTLVRPALELANALIQARYAGDGWNVYLAQASDGDCGAEDGARSAAYASDVLLPQLRYFAYVDIPHVNGLFRRPSDLWQSYGAIAHPAFARRQVHGRGDLWPVFRDLFARKAAA